MLEIVRIIDNKPTPTPGQIWVRDNATYLINCVYDDVLWAYKLSVGEVTEYAIELKNSWRFKLFSGSASERDQIIDAMVDALYEQDDLEDSDRIYELEKLGRQKEELHRV